MDEQLGAAVAALRRGEVVGVPTDTVFGLAVRFGDAEAFERLAEVKGRDAAKATAVLVGGRAGAEAVAHLDDLARRLIDAFWPGGLTLVVPRRAGVDAELGGDGSTIGIRHAASAVVDRLVADVGPIVASSANRAGEAPLLDAASVRERFGAVVATVLEGRSPGGVASTVVDLTGGRWTVLRVGSVSEDEVRAALQDGL